jgi:hypothetical protein
MSTIEINDLPWVDEHPWLAVMLIALMAFALYCWLKKEAK